MEGSVMTVKPTPWRIGRDTTRLGTWTVTNGIKTYHCFRKCEALAKLARLLSLSQNRKNNLHPDPTVVLSKRKRETQGVE